jgi:chromosome segregation ATPase
MFYIKGLTLYRKYGNIKYRYRTYVQKIGQLHLIKSNMREGDKLTDRELLELLVEKVTGLEERMDSQEKRMYSMEKRIDSMGERMDSMEKRMDSMGERMYSMEKRMDSMGERMYSMGGSMDSLGERMDSMEHKFEKRFDAMETELKDFRAETNKKLDNLQAQSDVIAIHVLKHSIELDKLRLRPV